MLFNDPESRFYSPGFFRSCGSNVPTVPHYRISEAAGLLAVSDDTVRRWIEAGQLPADRDAAGRRTVDGAALAEFARAQARSTPDPSPVGRSARNRLVGLVTEVISDRVMSQVEIQCGPHRVVSLMSTEAVRELGLAPGVLAVAVVKSTNVVVETPEEG
jgi:molybdopterin-binding protein